ncbi:unnamed protein product [Didymodactylos carnosus]|uniref:Uncharacterized protein n=1 Tax=Didymodactylos carnosus TaxID=1234261 RepID=A0A814DES6_9BILA|nr:unnamed protein product [Didymodactylos carnosus]CAF3727730.1 unnamed protein product [Didymodactylos carnosus]
MTLCLASSLIVKKGFAAYDQLVRYKWWWRQGCMSSTGRCFDSGHSTKAALDEFVNRQHKFKQNLNIDFKELDLLTETLVEEFDTKCSRENIVSNGSLMRLAPVLLFYCQAKSATYAIHYAGESFRITHAGKKAVDACRFYGFLLYAALNGRSKHDLLDKKFYELKLNAGWYGSEPLHPDIVRVAEGSYQTKDRNKIKASVMAEQTLEAARWAFYNDGDSFHVGVLKCVNLGDRR